jgi:hypothetical protein
MDNDAKTFAYCACHNPCLATWNPRVQSLTLSRVTNVNLKLAYVRVSKNNTTLDANIVWMWVFNFLFGKKSTYVLSHSNLHWFFGPCYSPLKRGLCTLQINLFHPKTNLVMVSDILMCFRHNMSKTCSKVTRVLICNRTHLTTNVNKRTKG